MNAGVRAESDITLIPVLAHYKTISVVIDGNEPINRWMSTLGIVPQLTRSIDVIEIDCIEFRKGMHGKALFNFLSLDKSIGWLFLASMLTTALGLASFNYKFFLQMLQRAIESLFDIYKFFKSKFYCLFILWVSACCFFRQLFGGDMFSRMATPPLLDVIDSWRDLAKRPGLNILAVRDDGDSDVGNFVINTTLP